MRKGQKHSEKTKEKLRAKLKGKILDPAIVERRNAVRRRNHPFWHSEETIEKIRAASTGVVPSEETRRRISFSLKNREMSLEERAGRAWGLRGKPRSEETREKIKYGMKRYWERKKLAEVKVDQEIADNLSEVRGAIKHKKERRKIEGGDV